ncbi:AP-1-like transcription factor, partial [Phenoliferia sp. Uapishka_3]
MEEEHMGMPDAPAKIPAKRGRKKVPLPEELDAMEDALDGTKGDLPCTAEPALTLWSAGGEATRKRGKRPELSAAEKRKLQNRAAQRAFRERKEKHVKDLEDRVVAQENQLELFRDMLERLNAENQALRRGEEVPVSHFELPPPMAKLEPPVMKHDSPSSATEAPEHNQSPTDAAFALRELDLTAFTVPASASASASEPVPTTFYNSLDPILAPSKLPVQPMGSTPFLPPPPVDPNFDLNNFEFDFDAPFDFSSAIPLPPLYQDLFNQSFPMNSPVPVAVPFDYEQTDAEEDCPGDDDDLPLPNGRIPCDKPECDFSLISCALPIPWRPPAINKETPPKDVWVCTQAWAKLCSHPMFGDCDVDELCHELRDKTLCSDDGRLVILKKDVCSVFRTIPARARAKREMDTTS